MHVGCKDSTLGCPVQRVELSLNPRVADRRQLLQEARHLEADCWDRRLRWLGPTTPVVTHGHTFCTTADVRRPQRVNPSVLLPSFLSCTLPCLCPWQFDDVAKAVSECAFVTSDLPVILSLEMHCSRKMQHTLTRMLLSHLPQELVMVRRIPLETHGVPTATRIADALVSCTFAVR
eukprot:2278519-Prymnesium_polylepis.2